MCTGKYGEYTTQGPCLPFLARPFTQSTIWGSLPNRFTLIHGVFIRSLPRTRYTAVSSNKTTRSPRIPGCTISCAYVGYLGHQAIAFGVKAECKSCGSIQGESCCSPFACRRLSTTELATQASAGRAPQNPAAWNGAAALRKSEI